MFDTGITTVTRYLSGYGSTNFYVSYLLILLIVAFAPTLPQMIGLSVILWLSYAAVLYCEIGELGALGESHWLPLPIRLILAIFYGSTTPMKAHGSSTTTGRAWSSRSANVHALSTRFVRARSAIATSWKSPLRHLSSSDDIAPSS